MKKARKATAESHMHARTEIEVHGQLRIPMICMWRGILDKEEVHAHIIGDGISNITTLAFSLFPADGDCGQGNSKGTAHEATVEIYCRTRSQHV